MCFGGSILRGSGVRGARSGRLCSSNCRRRCHSLPFLRMFDVGESRRLHEEWLLEALLGRECNEPRSLDDDVRILRDIERGE